MARGDPALVLRSVGRRIAELRRERDMTQESFAEQAGVSVGYVRRLEAGSENLTLVSLVSLTNLLRVHVIDLLKQPRSLQVQVGRPPSGAAKKARGR